MVPGLRSLTLLMLPQALVTVNSPTLPDSLMNCSVQSKCANADQENYLPGRMTLFIYRLKSYHMSEAGKSPDSYMPVCLFSSVRQYTQEASASPSLHRECSHSSARAGEGHRGLHVR